MIWSLYNKVAYNLTFYTGGMVKFDCELANTFSGQNEWLQRKGNIPWWSYIDQYTSNEHYRRYKYTFTKTKKFSSYIHLDDPRLCVFRGLMWKLTHIYRQNLWPEFWEWACCCCCCCWPIPLVSYSSPALLHLNPTNKMFPPSRSKTLSN